MTPFCVVHDPAGAAGDAVRAMGARSEAAGFGAMELLDLGVVAFARAGQGGLLLRDGIAVVADARIDDRARLAAELGVAADLPATELIHAAWCRWGADCPVHLLGDYAFVIWDEGSGALFAARDHIGARPFFYAAERDRLIAASDIGLVLAGGASDEIDLDAVATKLCDHNFTPTDRTFLKAVHRLAPGHRLIRGRGPMRIDRFWRPELLPPTRYGAEDEYFAALRQLIMTAVEDRLQGDAAVGVHVSGGLDCTSVAAIAVDRLRASERADPIGFSWNPPLEEGQYPSGPEQEWIEAARTHLGIAIHAPIPSGEDVVRIFAADFTREPDAGNLSHEDAVQRAAATQGIGVILSGWGGDEAASFNGRGLYAEMLWKGRWRALAREARAAGTPIPRLFAAAARILIGAFLPRVAHRLPVRSARSLADRAFLRSHRRIAGPRYRQRSVRRAQFDLLERGHITARIEDWAIAGARHGIEYRYPMLDRRVLEFAYSVPPELFRRGRWNRWLMRNAVAPLLPASLAWNPSKQEPDRIARLMGPVREAFGAIERELGERSTLPIRSAWIDLPRLRDQLRRAAVTGEFKLAPLRTALQFLDWERPG